MFDGTDPNHIHEPSKLTLQFLQLLSKQKQKLEAPGKYMDSLETNFNPVKNCTPNSSKVRRDEAISKPKNRES